MALNKVYTNCNYCNQRLTKYQKIKRNKSCSRWCRARFRHISIVGQKFNKLTALRLIRPRRKSNGKYNKYRYVCKCDCGNIITVNKDSLKFGHTKSCGCLHRGGYGESSFNHIYSSYKSTAKRRNIKFKLTKEQFRKLTSLKCFYCNEPPSNIFQRRGGYGKFIYNGIDRINNSLNYTLNNVVPCCKLCNYRKWGQNIKEFKKWVKVVYNNLYYVRV